MNTFAAKYDAKYLQAVACLTKDRDALLAFYDFPAEHWRHIRTTNPIESVFATVRHRTVRTKGCLSHGTTLAMVFKLIAWGSKESCPLTVLATQAANSACFSACGKTRSAAKDSPSSSMVTQSKDRPDRSASIASPGLQAAKSSSWRCQTKMDASVHASIHNHFNHQRHLNRRDIFKQDRATALAEWRQLAA